MRLALLVCACSVTASSLASLPVQLKAQLQPRGSLQKRVLTADRQNAFRSAAMMAMPPLAEELGAQASNWNLLLLGAALTFGGAFEFGVEALEERVPPRLLPVVQQSVIELATLGFVGLIIETVRAMLHATPHWSRYAPPPFAADQPRPRRPIPRWNLSPIPEGGGLAR